MKYAVIDIGSNSVRLMMSDGVKTLYKNVMTTRLAEGMSEDCLLLEQAMRRTVGAVVLFVNKAKQEFADDIFVFATAAVRKSKNKDYFLDLVKKECGIDVDVISGETEAKCGYIGALGKLDGGVIDVGGASTEVIVVENSKKIFSKSLDIGAVSVSDKCGQVQEIAAEYVLRRSLEYGEIPTSNFYAIGGTATSIAAMIQELDIYDPNKVDGFVVSFDELKQLTDKLYLLTEEERKKLRGLQPERARVIASGCQILFSVMKRVGLKKITVSESDNLEGYLMLKTERL